MIHFKVFFVLLFINHYLLSQGDESVIIGNQEWTLNNLCTRVFQNGDSIPFAKSRSEWNNAQPPMCCYLEGDSLRKKELGLLYNWYAVVDTRGIAPIGFRIPSSEDYKELLAFIGSNETACLNLKDSNWSKNTVQNSGFNAFPVGMRFYKGMYDYKGVHTGFWTTDKGPAYYNAIRLMIPNDCMHANDMIGPAVRSAGYSVRCLRIK